MKEGEVEQNLYLVKSGAVRVFYLSEFEEQTIRFGYEGSLINSLSSFINGKPTEFYIETIRKTTLNVIPKNTLLNLVYENEESLKQYICLLETLITQQIDSGNYFANVLKVNDGKIKKIKSPKDKNPGNSSLNSTTTDRFIKQLKFLKSLLVQAQIMDLTKVKTAISLTRLIRLRLGDTLRVVVYHIERHIMQAEKVLQQQAGKQQSSGSIRTEEYAD